MSQQKTLSEKHKDFGNIGIVCTSQACNKTTTKTEGISTDVLVHVKTNVNVAVPNTTKEDVPDIPIVLGYGGLSSQNPTPSGYPTNPRVADNPVFNNENNHFVPSNPETIPLPQPSYNFKPSRPTAHHPRYNTRNYKNVGFQTNGIQIQIPHLPNFNNHYFGENPPPQLVWYPKGNPSFNPLEFKRVHRPSSNPLSWNYNRIQPSSPGYPKYDVTSAATTCTCQTNGLNRYPTLTPSWQVSSNAHESHIDDKLAPLN